MEQRTLARLAIVAHEIFDGCALRGPGAVLIEGDRILGLGAASDAEATGVERVELDKGFLLAPGLVDCQVNGADGVLLNDGASEAAIRRIASTHQAFGTTSLLPTLITGAREGMERLCDIDPRAIAGVPGFHLEGPFINVERRGVHSAGFVRELSGADMELLSAFAQRGACMLTLAPERLPPGGCSRDLRGRRHGLARPQRCDLPVRARRGGRRRARRHPSLQCDVPDRSARTRARGRGVRG